MTHVCCPGCGVRFSRVTAVNLVACPHCGEPPQPVPSAEHLLGYRLAAVADDELPAAQAVAVSMAVTPPADGGA